MQQFNKILGHSFYCKKQKDGQKICEKIRDDFLRKLKWVSRHNLAILEQNEAKVGILFWNCLSFIVKITHGLFSTAAWQLTEQLQ